MGVLKYVVGVVVILLVGAVSFGQYFSIPYNNFSDGKTWRVGDSIFIHMDSQGVEKSNGDSKFQNKFTLYTTNTSGELLVVFMTGTSKHVYKVELEPPKYPIINKATVKTFTVYTPVQILKLL